MTPKREREKFKENKAINEQIKNKKDQGIVYYNERFVPRGLYKIKSSCCSPKYVFSFIFFIAIIFFIYLSLIDPNKKTLSNSLMSIDLEFSHYEGIDVPTMIRVNFISKKNELNFPSGTTIFFEFRDDKYSIMTYPIVFETERTLQKDNRIPYIFQVPKTNFIKSTKLYIRSEIPAFDKSIRLR